MHVMTMRVRERKDLQGMEASPGITDEFCRVDLMLGFPMTRLSGHMK